MSKTIAITVLVISAVGLAILLAAVPAKRRLTISLAGTRPDTMQYARELAGSPVARFLDPEGHDILANALAVDARVEARGSRNLDEIGLYLDPTLATDRHQIGVDHARYEGIAALAMIFLGSLIGFVLWLRDQRSGLWLAATTLLGLAFLPIALAIQGSLTYGLSLAALLVAAIATVGRQSVVAMRLRGPRELR